MHASAFARGVDGGSARTYIHGAMLSDLNERSREIFRLIVDSYMETGEPVGSRTLSNLLGKKLSPATVRNVMADLEDVGLLFSPHTSAGRLPTDAGLRLFVDGLLEVGNLTEQERGELKAQCAAGGNNLEAALETATASLAGLSNCASLVMAPKTESALKHVEFVSLAPGRTLVVLVTESGVVENRVIETPHGLPPSALVEAGNYLSSRMLGHTLSEAQIRIHQELEGQQAQLDVLTAKVVEAGLATWTGGDDRESLIVRGQANLLDNVTAMQDLEQIRTLFEALETKEGLIKLLNLADSAVGVQIFIGSDNQLFNMAGCSLIVGPYRNAQEKIVGALGVIGPSRMNYARIIPMVDYTAKLIGRMVG